MTDLISRQEALDAVEESRRLNHHQDSKAASAHEYEHRHFLKILRELPPADPQWIPVSERMPEDGQYVLFCDIDEDIMLGYHVKGRPDTHFSQDGSWDDMKNVLAWMPLPNPYKGDKE